MRWIEDHPRCLLFLDMGLGKTVVTLTALQRLYDHAEIGRVLIVAPKKVAESTWHAEMGKWSHLHLSISLALGDERHRMAAIESDADVVVMGRDNVDWLRSMYERRKTFPFDTLVIDELTGFKSHSSARFRAVRWMRRHLDRIIGMTGTPVPNGLLDLWAQVYCIDGGERLDTFFGAYRSRWFDTVTHNNVVIKAWPKKGAEEEIMAAISDIALTMRSEDYLELPEMTEVDVPVTLPEVTLEWYRRFERDKIIDIRNRVGDMRKLTAESAAPLANKLAQYANGQVYDDDRGVIETHDRKLNALGEILEDDERPLLVFYQYRHDRDRIMSRFKEMKPRCYEGDAELRDWNEGRIRLLLAHPASTAYGLNMQRGGHRIVWYSTGWNLELYKQANARLHRQGQREHVVVMRLVAKGTIDERMIGVLGDKNYRQNGFLDDMKHYIRDYGKGQ